MPAPNTALAETKAVKRSFDLGTKMTIENFINLPYLGVKTTFEWNEIFNSTEDLIGTRQLSELEAADVNKLEEGFQTSLTPNRFGNAIQVSETEQVKMKDNTTLVRQFLNRQKNALLRDIKNKMAVDFHLPLNDGFTGAFHLAPDSVALFGTHSWNTAGAATWDNSATEKLSIAAWDAVEAYGGDFKTAGDKPNPVNFDTVIVKKGGAASRLAIKQFAQFIKPVAIGDINMYEGTVTVIEDPYITDTNAWYAYASNFDDETAIYNGINKAPTMAEPILDKNLAVYSAVTGFWKTGIIELPIMWFGSQGTT